MELERIEEEIYENGNRKINIGVRAYSELKLKLSDEAQALGISLSEHCENILITHKDLLAKVNQLTASIEILQEQNESLQSALDEIDVVAYEGKISHLTDQNAQLKSGLAEFRSNDQIYSDPRLLDLFSKVKGKNDRIITNNGEMNLVFHSPKDVLLALIYSYTL